MDNAHKHGEWNPRAGDQAVLRINGVKAIVLKELEADKTIGRKFLTRDTNHQLRQVFLCEMDKWEAPAVTY